MRRFLLSIALCLVAFSAPFTPALAGITYAGGNGSSIGNAIVIRGATGEIDGIPSEYAWLRRHRPGWRVLEQQLVFHEKRPYDILILRKGGRTERVHFDISGYFGH